MVDSTFATPVVCRPLEHGADLVIHSATKYIGGHDDCTGGVVVGRPDLMAQIREVRIDTGGTLSPDDAFLLRRGLETLPLRVRRHVRHRDGVRRRRGQASRPSAASTTRACPDHPGHQLARQLFDSGPEGTRYGACVTVTPHGGYERRASRWPTRSSSRASRPPLGGTRTKVSHVASTTHRRLDEAGLTASGIDAGAVRFSIGPRGRRGPHRGRHPGARRAARSDAARVLTGRMTAGAG